MGLCRKYLWRRDSEKGKSCHMGSSGSASFTKESARVGFLQKQSVDRVGNKEKRVGSLLGGVRSFYIQELWIL